MVEINKINQDINLIKAEDYFEKNSDNLIESDINGLVIYFNFNAETEYKSLHSPYELKAKKRHTIIDLVKEDEGIYKVHKNTHRESLSLLLSKEFIIKNSPNDKTKDIFLDFFTNGRTVENLSNKMSDSKTQLLAYDIFKSSCENNLDRLYIESKVLELTYNEFKTLLQEDKEVNSTKFSLQDKESIYQAKDILLKNLSNPPSMKELAKMVAINDLKLKIGFNKFFGQSPYSISLDYRLEEAKKLLYNSDMNINEIAQHVGYKHPANFSKAFSKKFGIPPKELMKKRKYYY